MLRPSGHRVPPMLAVAILVGSCGQPLPAPHRAAAPPAKANATAPAAAPPPVFVEESVAVPADVPPPAPLIEESAPPSAPLRWVSARQCALTYDYRVVHRTEVLSSGTTNGFDTLGQIEGLPDPVVPSRLKMRFLWTRRDGLGPRGAIKGVRADDDQPEIVLVTDGARWREAPQWPPPARPPDFDRLSQIFPTLPDRVPPGSEAAWKPPQPASTVLPIIDSARLKISRWIRVGGELAVEIEGSWAKEKSTEEQNGGQRVVRRGAVRGAARFVVLASGRLLASEVNQSNDTFTAVQDAQGTVAARAAPNESRENVSSELRLVKACSGVTLPPLHPPPSADERALLTYTRLRKAVSQPDRSGIAALLGPTIAARTGKDPIVTALVSYLTRFGPTSLGFLGTPRTTAVTDGDRITFPVTGFATDGRGGHSVRVLVTIVVERKGDDFWLRSIKAATNSATGQELLEVSDTRVFVAETAVLTSVPTSPGANKR